MDKRFSILISQSDWDSFEKPSDIVHWFLKDPYNFYQIQSMRIDNLNYHKSFVKKGLRLHEDEYELLQSWAWRLDLSIAQVVRRIFISVLEIENEV